jgi:hypothetical protein
MKIFNQDMAPLVLPNRKSQSASDTVIVRYNNEGSIIQEIFKRSNGTFGFRYQAWVNYADAGGNPHHGWGEFVPQSNSIVGSIEDAKAMAEINSKESEILFGQWLAT